MIQGSAHKKTAVLALAAMLFATVGVFLVHPLFHSHEHCLCDSSFHLTGLGDQSVIQIGVEDSHNDYCLFCRFLSIFQSDYSHFPVSASFESLRLPCVSPIMLLLSAHFRPSTGPRGPPFCYSF